VALAHGLGEAEHGGLDRRLVFPLAPSARSRRIAVQVMNVRL
jgi:hypothetical protein